MPPLFEASHFILVLLSRVAGGVPPVFFAKSVQREERERDERGTENERARKRLKRKRGESGFEVKRTKEGMTRGLAWRGAIITRNDSTSVVTL